MPVQFLVSSLCLITVDQNVSHQLMLQHPAGLLAVMLPTMMVMGSNPLQL